MDDNDSSTGNVSGSSRARSKHQACQKFIPNRFKKNLCRTCYGTKSSHTEIAIENIEKTVLGYERFQMDYLCLNECCSEVDFSHVTGLCDIVFWDSHEIDVYKAHRRLYHLDLPLLGPRVSLNIDRLSSTNWSITVPHLGHTLVFSRSTTSPNGDVNSDDFMRIFKDSLRHTNYKDSAMSSANFVVLEGWLKQMVNNKVIMDVYVIVTNSNIRVYNSHSSFKNKPELFSRSIEISPDYNVLPMSFNNDFVFSIFVKGEKAQDRLYLKASDQTEYNLWTKQMEELIRKSGEKLVNGDGSKVRSSSPRLAFRVKMNSPPTVAADVKANAVDGFLKTRADHTPTMARRSAGGSNSSTASSSSSLRAEDGNSGVVNQLRSELESVMRESAALRERNVNLEMELRKVEGQQEDLRVREEESRGVVTRMNKEKQSIDGELKKLRNDAVKSRTEFEKDLRRLKEDGRKSQDNKGSELEKLKEEFKKFQENAALKKAELENEIKKVREEIKNSQETKTKEVDTLTVELKEIRENGNKSKEVKEKELYEVKEEVKKLREEASKGQEVKGSELEKMKAELKKTKDEMALKKKVMDNEVKNLRLELKKSQEMKEKEMENLRVKTNARQTELETELETTKRMMKEEEERKSVMKSMENGREKEGMREELAAIRGVLEQLRTRGDKEAEVQQKRKSIMIDSEANLAEKLNGLVEKLVSGLQKQEEATVKIHEELTQWRPSQFQVKEEETPQMRLVHLADAMLGQSRHQPISALSHTMLSRDGSTSQATVDWDDLVSSQLHKLIFQSPLTTSAGRCVSLYHHLHSDMGLTTKSMATIVTDLLVQLAGRLGADLADEVPHLNTLVERVIVKGHSETSMASQYDLLNSMLETAYLLTHIDKSRPRDPNSATVSMGAVQEVYLATLGLCLKEQISEEVRKASLTGSEELISDEGLESLKKKSSPVERLLLQRFAVARRDLASREAELEDLKVALSLMAEQMEQQQHHQNHRGGTVDQLEESVATLALCGRLLCGDCQQQVTIHLDSGLSRQVGAITEALRGHWSELDQIKTLLATKATFQSTLRELSDRVTVSVEALAKALVALGTLLQCEIAAPPTATSVASSPSLSRSSVSNGGHNDASSLLS